MNLAHKRQSSRVAKIVAGTSIFTCLLAGLCVALSGHITRFEQLLMLIQAHITAPLPRLATLPV